MQEKILAHSLRIFNEEGPQQASLRHLARQLGISDGHLRYYFKTKDILILALLDEFATKAEALEGDLLPSAGNSFPDFLQALLPHFRLRVEYRFLLMDSHHLSHAIPGFADKMKAVLQSRRDFIGEALSRLQFSGILESDLPQWRFDLLLDQFHHLSLSFLRNLTSTNESVVISQGIQLSVGTLLSFIAEKDRKMATVQLLAV